MKTILIIDDDALLRQVIKTFLRAHGYQIIEAENGLLGWQLIQEEIPDLIICDLMLPDLDGIKILKRLRQNPLIKHIPFIIISANQDSDSQDLLRELGANYYLTKPFISNELITVISQYLIN